MKNEDMNQMIRFAVPVALENLFTQIIALLIPALIGGISGSALAGTGMGNTVVSLLNAIFAILTIGGAVLLARSIGAKNWEDASHMAEQSVLLTLLMSAALAVSLWLGAARVMRLLMPTAEEGMLQEAVLYFRYMMISFPAMMIYTVGAALLRAAGNTKEPMVVTIVLNIVTVALAALLIRGSGLGMDGAGIAYVLARFIAAALTVLMLIRYQGSFRFRIKKFLKPHLPTWKRIFRIGVPASLEATLVQGGYLLGNTMTVGLGALPATVYQIINTFYNFAAYPQNIASPLIVSFIGKKLGAGQEKEAKRTAQIIYFSGMGVTVVLASVIMLLTGRLSTLYSSDPWVLEECRKLAWLVLALNILAMSINGMDPGLKAGGDGNFVMTYTILGVWLVRVPLTWLFCYQMDMGVLGVFLANIVSLVSRSVIGQIRFYSGKWIHKNV